MNWKVDLTEQPRVLLTGSWLPTAWEAQGGVKGEEVGTPPDSPRSPAEQAEHRALKPQTPTWEGPAAPAATGDRASPRGSVAWDTPSSPHTVSSRLCNDGQAERPTWVSEASPTRMSWRHSPTSLPREKIFLRDGDTYRTDCQLLRKPPG